jgi:hypothetical protein
MRKSLGATLLSAVWVVGCAGNGDGLNQNGMPIVAGQTGGGPITPDFQSIEDNVFTPICSKCHIGAGAPEGLQLDAAHAYNALVGVPSVEEPSFLRVNPGNPDMSYMVLKIEGAPGIEGGQMPLGETPLPQATIDAIRQWIANGAPNVPGAAAAAAAQPFAIQDTLPVHESLVLAPLARITVVFNHAVDGSVMNDTSYSLERVGDADIDLDHLVSTPGAKIGASGELAERNPAVLLITPSDALPPGVYRLSIRGAGPDALTDLNAEPLGGDNSIVFTVEPTP